MKTQNPGWMRTLAVIALVGVLTFAAQPREESGVSLLDLHALLMVVTAPLLVWVISASEIPLSRSLMQLFSVLKATQGGALGRWLSENSVGVDGRLSAARAVQAASESDDALVRRAGELLAARYEGEELQALLGASAAEEEEAVASAVYAVSFLAKMSPYFGMLATVLGMVRLLQNLSDFSQISNGMSLALMGTLYGLGSFLLIYAPVQRWLQEKHRTLLERQEVIRRWAALISERAASELLREALSSRRREEVTV
jgi:flagellar motor component MotA